MRRVAESTLPERQPLVVKIIPFYTRKASFSSPSIEPMWNLSLAVPALSFLGLVSIGQTILLWHSNWEPFLNSSEGHPDYIRSCRGFKNKELF